MARQHGLGLWNSSRCQRPPRAVLARSQALSAGTSSLRREWSPWQERHPEREGHHMPAASAALGYEQRLAVLAELGDYPPGEQLLARLVRHPRRGRPPAGSVRAGRRRRPNPRPADRHRQARTRACRGAKRRRGRACRARRRPAAALRAALRRPSRAGASPRAHSAVRPRRPAAGRGAGQPDGPAPRGAHPRLTRPLSAHGGPDGRCGGVRAGYSVRLASGAGEMARIPIRGKSPAPALRLEDGLSVACAGPLVAQPVTVAPVRQCSDLVAGEFPIRSPLWERPHKGDHGNSWLMSSRAEMRSVAASVRASRGPISS
jgi:hypothetical protein